MNLFNENMNVYLKSHRLSYQTHNIMDKTIIQLRIICKNIILSFIFEANRKR